MLRRLIGVAGEIAEIAYDEPDDVTKALDEAESKVFELAEHRVVDSTKPIGDLLELAIDRPRAGLRAGRPPSPASPPASSTSTSCSTGCSPPPSTWSAPGPPWASASPGTPRCSTRPPASSSPPPSSTGAGSDGGVGAGGLPRPTTAACVVATPVGVRRRRGEAASSGAHPPRADASAPRLSHPFLTEAGWRRWRDLAPGVPVAVPSRACPWFGHDAPPGRRARAASWPTYLGDGGLRCTAEHRRRRRSGAPLPASSTSTRSRCCAATAAGDARRRLAAPVAGPPAPASRSSCSASSTACWTSQPRRPGRHRRPSTPSWPASSASPVTSSTCSLRFGVLTSLRARRAAPRRAQRRSLVVDQLVPSCTADADDARAVAAASRAPRAVRAGAPVGGSRSPRPRRRAGTRSSPSTTRGTEQVYDLTVPGLHNFVAADVVVHNTAFALGIATHVAVDAGTAGALLLAGDGPQGAHPAHPRRRRRGSTRKKLRTGKLTEQDWSKIGQAVGRLEAPLFIDDNPHVTVMEIRAKARRMKARARQARPDRASTTSS